MKFNIFLIAILFGLFSLTSCDKDDEEEMETFDYHAHIMKPTTDDKMMGDTMHIHVNFEEHDGKTIHHVQVRIYNSDDDTEISMVEGTAFGEKTHIHEESGAYQFHYDVPLTEENGFKGHGNYILEAIASDHDSMNEAKETVAFHVHPN